LTDTKDNGENEIVERTLELSQVSSCKRLFLSTGSPRRGKKFRARSPEPDLRRAIDVIPQLVWSAFPDGAVEFCNQRWLEYTGLTAEQVQGWGWGGAIHPEDLDELVATWRRVLAEGVPGEAEARMRMADGTVRWFLIRAMPQRDDQGRIVRWYGTNTDIDDRKRLEKALAETEQRFRLIADTAPVLIWMSGTDKLCTYFNKPWLEFTGRSIDFELGNGWAEGVHPEDLRRCMDTYTQTFDRRGEFRMEYRRRRHDGEYRWVLDIGVPRFNQEGSFVGYIGIGVDITDRKRAEEALSSMSRKLIEAQEQERTGSPENFTTTPTNVSQCWQLGSNNSRTTSPSRLVNFAVVWTNCRSRFWRYRVIFKPCRTSCTRQSWNIWE
jgi:PAS domain S-box-containing protein